jgi:hypothetical protein
VEVICTQLSLGNIKTPTESSTVLGQPPWKSQSYDMYKTAVAGPEEDNPLAVKQKYK